MEHDRLSQGLPDAGGLDFDGFCERGMLIGFGQMPKEARAALDSILEAAPAIQVLTESDEDSGPVVVSESIFD